MEIKDHNEILYKAYSSFNKIYERIRFIEDEEDYVYDYLNEIFMSTKTYSELIDKLGCKISKLETNNESLWLIIRELN